MMAINFLLADYNNPVHATAVVDLLDEYARDPIGGGEPLAPFVRENLITTLSEASFAFSILGFNDEGAAVALANCFRTLSSFSCLPLINIHDLVIAQAAREQGVSQLLLAFIESHARETGCCKVTLEVLEHHTVAKKAYAKFGFEPYTLDEEYGHAMYMQKKL